MGEFLEIIEYLIRCIESLLCLLQSGPEQLEVNQTGHGCVFVVRLGLCFSRLTSYFITRVIYFYFLSYLI